MITVTEYKGQKVGVFGLGKAGEAAIAALLAGGAEVFAWDDRLSSPSPFKGEGRGDGKIAGEENPHPSPLPRREREIRDWPWSDLKALILSPGVPLTHPKPHAVVELASKHNVPVIGEMELLYRAQPEATYIGITGTNGKSTTTTLIGHILKESGVRCEVGGNLGTPALALEPLAPASEKIILEVTSPYKFDGAAYCAGSNSGLRACNNCVRVYPECRLVACKHGLGLAGEVVEHAAIGVDEGVRLRRLP